MKLLLLLVCLGLTIMLPPSTAGAEKAAVETSSRSLNLMRSANYLEREQAIRDLKRERDEIIHELIVIFEGEFPLEVKLDSARALGKYRANEAVSILVKNLALEDEPRLVLHGLISDDEQLSLMRPISTALEKIGTPAIPTLLQRLSSTDNTKLVGKCVSILSAIDGHDIAIVRLKRAFDAEQTEERKLRLQAAIQTLEGTKTK